jgi:hypothetical protein
MLSNPARRLVKVNPNDMNIVRRAFMSTSSDLSMNMVLYVITFMSFRMRSRVYEMA